MMLLLLFVLRLGVDGRGGIIIIVSGPNGTEEVEGCREWSTPKND